MECPQCSFDYDPCGGSCKGCPSEHKSHTTFPCNACCRKVTIHDQYGRSGVRGGRYVPRFDFCPNCGVSLKPEKKAAEWVKWPSIHDSRWACSGCSHQMGAANAGQLPEECPGCGATMVVSEKPVMRPGEPAYPDEECILPPPTEEPAFGELSLCRIQERLAKEEPENVKSYSEALVDLNQSYRSPPEEPEKGGVYHLICPECGWTCSKDHGGTLKECPSCGASMEDPPPEEIKGGMSCDYCGSEMSQETKEMIVYTCLKCKEPEKEGKCPRCGQPVPSEHHHRHVLEYHNDGSGSPRIYQWKCPEPPEEPQSCDNCGIDACLKRGTEGVRWCDEWTTLPEEPEKEVE